MAHMIEMIDGQAQMAYRSSQGTPWHGLGVAVGDDMTPEEMMSAAGLNWTVSKTDTFVDFNGKRIKTGTQALIRESDGKILTQVGPGWNPVQNKDAFDFFSDFVEKGDMIMDTAGSLKDGRIVWALADVRDGFTLFGGDEVKGYLLFSNPHLYGKSIDVKFVLTRVVCNNTIAVALNEKGQPSVRVNHRAKFDAERVKEVLGLSHRKVEKFKEAAEFLGSKQANVVNIQDYFGKVFGESTKEGKQLGRTAEMVMDLVETQPGAEFQKGSYWQVYNAVTYAVDHKLGRSADTRMTSAWFGANAKRKLDALNLAVEMAEAA
jgi:phage/plasmid-like protein (TIGR03299 family)